MHADDFTRTLRSIRNRYLREHAKQKEPAPLGSDQIHVYVRKRPLLPHEVENHEFDVISSIGQREIVIHECKMYNGAQLPVACLVRIRSRSLPTLG